MAQTLLSKTDDYVFIESPKYCGIWARWALETLLGAPNHVAQPKRRALFAWALAGYPKSARARDMLLTSSADTEPLVREHAIEALAEFRFHAAKQRFLEILRRGSPVERYWALFGLGTQADSRGADAIREHLGDCAEVPGLGSVAQEAKWALEQISKTR
jgi:HEAT repeat protein